VSKKVVQMIKEGLAPALAGLNESEPEVSLGLAHDLLTKWLAKIQEAHSDSKNTDD
jgi:hypothetical protein